MKRLRLFLALSVLTGAASVMTASPAQACINPDDPTCQAVQVVCSTKYRDRVAICQP